MDDAARTVRIEVELMLGSEPITGRVTRAHGESSFVGWVALVRALEDAMKEAGGEGEGDATS